MTTPPIEEPAKKDATICINMIVKDEENVLEDTLKNLIEKVKGVNYYVICDTGSTDKTKEIITTYFEGIGVTGEIHDTPWVDFGTNRSIALTKAEKAPSDWILVFDADDRIGGTSDFQDTIAKNPTATSLDLTFGTGFTYKRKVLFKNIGGWKYTGVLHEYPSGDKDKAPTQMHGDYHIASNRTGNRSQDPLKYQKDAAVLVKALEVPEKDIEPRLRSRYTFYAGQSFFDSQDYKNAAKYYVKRYQAEIKSPFELFKREAFYGLYRLGQCCVRLGAPDAVIEKACVRAFLFSDGQRPEPLHELSCYYRNKLKLQKAFFYSKMGLESANQLLSKPVFNELFLNRNICERSLHDEVSISGTYTGDMKTASTSYAVLLKPGDKPPDPRVVSNSKFAKVKTIAFYVGYYLPVQGDSMNTEMINLKNFISHFSSRYNVILIGPKLKTGTRILLDGGNHTDLIDSYEALKNPNINIDYLILYKNAFSFFMDHHVSNPACKIYVWFAYNKETIWNGQPIKPENVLANMDRGKISGYITPTELSKTNLIKEYGDSIEGSKIHVIPNGLDFMAVADTGASHLKRLICFTAAKETLQIFTEHLLPLDPDLKLVVCEDVSEDVKKAHSNNVIFKGALTQAQAIDELKTAGILLYINGSPTPPLREALMCGCICVYSSSTPEIKDIVGDRGIEIKGSVGSKEFIEDCKSVVSDVSSGSETPLDRNAKGWVYTNCSWGNSVRGMWERNIFGGCGPTTYNKGGFPYTKIWCINSPKHIHRLKDFRFKAACVGVNDLVIVKENVEGTDKLITSKRYKNLNVRTTAVVGTAEAHIGIWDDLISGADEFVMVCEDDVAFDQEFVIKFKEIHSRLLENKRGEWDILYLGGLKGVYSDKDFNVRGVPVRKLETTTQRETGCGVFGYCISRRGATKILDEIKTRGVTRTIDRNVLDSIKRLSLSAYTCDPEIVTSLTGETIVDFETEI